MFGRNMRPTKLVFEERLYESSQGNKSFLPFGHVSKATKLSLNEKYEHKVIAYSWFTKKD